MSFLNAAMALGAFAFIVPLGIHLLFRSRYRSMDWGAMFLLRDVVQANRRRMQWHHWILLAMRCAIPILLALAMARPLISSMRSMPGSQPISLVLVIDDSRSMSAAQRSSNALGAVNGLLDSLSRKDEVLFIRSSQVNAPATSGSAQDARNDLRELFFDGPEAELGEMVDAAITACSVASHPFCRIVICSDFQENVLSSTSSGSIESLASRLASMNPAAELDFLNIAADEQADALGNVVVESIETENPAVLVDRRVAMSAVIKNHSEASLPALRCVWSIDGVNVHTENVSLTPRGSTTLRWSHVFERVGGASVTMSVQHSDALPADNQRRIAIDVMRQIRVWLVDGSPSNEPLQSETDFLKVALSPFAFQATRHQADDSDNPRDVVSTKVLTSNAFRRAITKLNLPNRSDDEVPDLIVLANVKESAETEFSDSMRAYLRQGGNALIFDGDQINADPDKINADPDKGSPTDGQQDSQSGWDQCDWLPGIPMQTIELDRTFRIEPPGGRYKPWALLGGSGDSLFDSVEVQQIRKLKPRDEETNVLMRSESGLPLVLERSVLLGGRVVQFAIPCDNAWSNLPLRPVFLPLIQQLVLDLAGGANGLNGRPGSTMVITPPRLDAKVNRWRVTMPDGESAVLPVAIPINRSVEGSADSESSQLQFPSTSRVGVYRFVPLTEDESQSPLAASVRVIEISADESTLRPAAPEILQRTLERLGGNSFSSIDDWLAGAKQDRFGLEIWRPLLWGLLLVMIAEVLWQQRGGTKVRVQGAAT